MLGQISHPSLNCFVKVLIRSTDFDLIDSKTRHWKPSDTYQRDQAQQGIGPSPQTVIGLLPKNLPEHPLSVFSRNTSLWLCLPIILLMFAFPNLIFAQQTRVDSEAPADRIANSVNELVGNYRTIAISRIKQRSCKRAIDLEQLIDYTNVKIVRGERFQVGRSLKTGN